MAWWVWVIVVAAVVGLPLLIALVFSSGEGMSGGGGGGGGMGGMFGPFEEIFAPSRHEARQEQENQKMRTSVAPSPDGPPPAVHIERGSAELSHIVLDDQPADSPRALRQPPPGWLDGKTKPPSAS